LKRFITEAALGHGHAYSDHVPRHPAGSSISGWRPPTVPSSVRPRRG